MPARYWEDLPIHPTGLPTERWIKNALRLMEVSTSASEYQYRNSSRLLKYVPMNITKEKAKRISADPRITCLNGVGPCIWMKNGGIMPRTAEKVSSVVKTNIPA